MLKFIQISDTHLFANKNELLKGSNTYENLEKVIFSISQISNLDFVVVTGDCSQDMSIESYKHLKNLLKKLNKKYFLIPGNHDDIENINKVFKFNWKKSFVDYSFQIDGWFFRTLDTTTPPEVHGEISTGQLQILDEDLEKNPRPTIILMHHHPISVKSSWIDSMGIRNTESKDLIKILEKYKEVKLVLFGHIHHAFEEKQNFISYYGCPATAYQVVPKTERFILESTKPGYRIIELYENTFSTSVVFLESDLES